MSKKNQPLKDSYGLLTQQMQKVEDDVDNGEYVDCVRLKVYGPHVCRFNCPRECYRAESGENEFIGSFLSMTKPITHFGAAHEWTHYPNCWVNQFILVPLNRFNKPLDVIIHQPTKLLAFVGEKRFAKQFIKAHEKRFFYEDTQTKTVNGLPTLIADNGYSRYVLKRYVEIQTF